jgi:hypothetical protein
LGLIFAIICENHEIGQLQLMFLPRKDDETYLFFNRYEESKGLAIIENFAAHCTMKNEQMAKGRKFKSKLES